MMSRNIPTLPHINFDKVSIACSGGAMRRTLGFARLFAALRAGLLVPWHSASANPEGSCSIVGEWHDSLGLSGMGAVEEDLTGYWMSPSVCGWPYEVHAVVAGNSYVITGADTGGHGCNNWVASINEFSSNCMVAYGTFTNNGDPTEHDLSWSYVPIYARFYFHRFTGAYI